MPVAWDDFDSRTTKVRCDDCHKVIETKDFVKALNATSKGRMWGLCQQFQINWRGRKFHVMEFHENLSGSASPILRKIPMWFKVKLWLRG